MTPLFESRELSRYLDEVGSNSLPLVGLADVAIGVVLSLEAPYSLTRFGAKLLLPAATVYSVTASVQSTFHTFGVACQTIAAASRIIDLMPGNDQWISSR